MEHEHSAGVGPIVTLTLNPALDVSSGVDVVAPSHKLRCDAPSAEPGGGGFNVSRVCQRLGHSTIAIAPLGGPVGEQLRSLVEAEGTPLHPIEVAGHTRQSMTITEATTDQQFRFVFPGPRLSPDELDRCLADVITTAKESSCLVVSGSMPDGVDGDAIERLVAGLPDTTIIVDTSGQPLADAVRAGVHVVKPSARELARLVDRELETEDEVQLAAEQIVDETNVGAVLVSIGAGGAILVERDAPTMRLRAPTVRVASAVGAGDSLVAGLACGLHNGLELIEATEFGVACGTAAVLSPGTELCRVDDIERLRPSVRVEPATHHPA